MTRDEQEALSRVYCPATIRALALQSGNWALFDQAKNLLAIVPFDQLSAELFELNLLLDVPGALPKSTPPDTCPIDLEELGL